MATIVCPNCGTLVTDDKKICPECGVLISAQPGVHPVSRTLTDEEAGTGKYEGMTGKQYLGSILLMMIPVLGWLLAIIWACGGCRKYAKRNLARGSLLYALITAAVAAAAVGITTLSIRAQERSAGAELTTIEFTQQGAEKWIAGFGEYILN